MEKSEGSTVMIIGKRERVNCKKELSKKWKEEKYIWLTSVKEGSRRGKGGIIERGKGCSRKKKRVGCREG